VPSFEGIRAAMIIADEFEDAEAVEPKKALEAAGIAVTVIGLRKGMHRGKRSAQLMAEKTFAEVSPRDFDLLVIPGGRAPERLRVEQAPVRFVKDFWEMGRPVAAICHGPQLLISAGVLAPGRRLTAWKGIRDDVKLTGAEVLDQPVVVDGNLVTSRQPSDIPQFNRAMLELLEKRLAA